MTDTFSKIGVDHVLLNLSKEISKFHCMNPVLIYEWAKKHNVDLAKFKAKLTCEKILRANDALWNDITFDRFDRVKKL